MAALPPGRHDPRPRLIADVAARYSLRDLTLEEPAIEDIVRRIYVEGLCPGERLPAGAQLSPDASHPGTTVARMTLPVGRVLGTEDATPLTFWVALAADQYLQLDDVVVCERAVPGRDEPVRLSGVVTQVRGPARGRALRLRRVPHRRRRAAGARRSRPREVLTTRVEPEVFVPPRPGAEVRRGDGRRARRRAVLRPDGAAAADRARPRRRCRCTPTSTSSTARAARTSTSRASPASRRRRRYATFLLYGLFHSGVLGDDATNTKALIFNVKGEDLLFLDHDNVAARRPDQSQKYRDLGLMPGAFKSTSRCSRRRASDDPNATPDVAEPHSSACTPSSGRSRSSSSEELLPFVFADAEDERQQYTMVVHNVGGRVEARRAAPRGDGGWRIDGADAAHVPRPRRLHRRRRSPTTTRRARDRGPAPATGMGTINAFVRRLLSSQRSLDRLVRADVADALPRHRIDTDDAQVTVVDLHNLADRAKRFVVGVTLRRAFDARSRAGHREAAAVRRARRAQQVRAARGRLARSRRSSSTSPSAAGRSASSSSARSRPRARSSGASSRNSSIRVVGRLDPAEAARPEYGFLPDDAPEAGDDRQAGHDVREAARDPGAARRRVPVPGVGDPARPSAARTPADAGAAAHPRRSVLGTAPVPAAEVVVKILHTSDWHVGKMLRGDVAPRRAPRRCSGEIAEHRRARGGRPRARHRRPVRVGRAAARGAARWCGTRCSRCATPARASSSSAATTTTSRRSTRGRPCSRAAGITVLGHAGRPEAGGVVESTTARASPRSSCSCRSCRSASRCAPSSSSSATPRRPPGSTPSGCALLIAALSAGFRPDTVNIVAAHCIVRGGMLGGGERDAQTVDDYAIDADALPGGGQLRRARAPAPRPARSPAPRPIWYAGSPIQVDFGEERDVKHVLLVEAAPGVPARVETRPI